MERKDGNGNGELLGRVVFVSGCLYLIVELFSRGAITLAFVNTAKAMMGFGN